MKPNPKYGWSQQIADDFTLCRVDGHEDIPIWSNPNYQSKASWLNIFGPEGSAAVEFMRWYDSNKVTLYRSQSPKPKRDPATIPSNSQVRAHRKATEEALRKATPRRDLAPCVTREQQVDGGFVRITFDYPYQPQGVAAKVPDQHIAWGVT